MNNWEQIKQQLALNQTVFDNQENEYKQSNQELVQLKEEYANKQELLSTLSTGISSTGNVTSGYITQLNDVKLKLNASENFIKTSTLKINHLQQQMESDQMKLIKAKLKMKHYYLPLNFIVNSLKLNN